MKPRMPGDAVAARYRIVRVLSQSGTCITYEAEESADGRERVVIKELALLGMRDWKVLELFEREAATLASLEHPAIPRYRECFVEEAADGTCCYTVQDLAPGQTLDALVRDGWQPAEDQVRDIARQLLDILAYLHGREPAVVHRDIKPQNILRDTDGRVFLVDFGAVQNTITGTLSPGTTIIGTLGYMAPEQLRGQATPASDLYSLGCTLLFLLARKPPGALPQKRLRVSFREHVQVSGSFAAWLDRMIAPAVEDRHATASEALSALARVQTGRRPRASRALRWASAAVAVALGLGGTTLAWRHIGPGQDAAIERYARASRTAQAPQGPRKPVRCEPLAPLRAPSKDVAILRFPLVSRPEDIDEAALLARLDRDHAVLARHEHVAFGEGLPAIHTEKQLYDHLEQESALAARLRSKAAIPYLLKTLYVHRLDKHLDGPGRSRIERVLVDLTGVPLPREDWDSSPAQRLDQLVNGWWRHLVEAGLSTDMSQMTNEQLEVVVSSILRGSKWLGSPSGTIHSQLERPFWRGPPKHPGYVLAMVPVLFDAALEGWRFEEFGEFEASGVFYGFDGFGKFDSAAAMLGYIHRRHGGIPGLAEVARGASCRGFDTLLAIRALQHAGEPIDVPALLALYEREQDVDLRMYVIARMGEMPQPEPVLPTLLDALESGSYDLEQAALEALQNHQRLYRLAAESDEIQARIDAAAARLRGSHTGTATEAELSLTGAPP